MRISDWSSDVCSSDLARAPAGVAALAATLKADLARVRAVDTAGLDHATRTSLAVIDSAYSTALDGFALPYGDVAAGGGRNTPYDVIPHVGACRTVEGSGGKEWLSRWRYRGSKEHDKKHDKMTTK